VDRALATGAASASEMEAAQNNFDNYRRLMNHVQLEQETKVMVFVRSLGTIKE
jgi:hypothetical protein